MSNEINVRASLQVKNGNALYQSQPTAFNANQATVGGPAPGMISAVTTGTGTTVSFSPLILPALCRIQNLDATNYVTIGELSGGVFHPLMEALPGEIYVIRLSRSLAALAIKANTAACKVVVEGFES